MGLKGSFVPKIKKEEKYCYSIHIAYEYKEVLIFKEISRRSQCSWI